MYMASVDQTTVRFLALGKKDSTAFGHSDWKWFKSVQLTYRQDRPPTRYS